jgi:transposase InsO family protein
VLAFYISDKESFFCHLKDDMNDHHCKNIHELHAVVDDYIDYYNHERGQWKLKKLPPVSYRGQYLLNVS